MLFLDSIFGDPGDKQGQNGADKDPAYLPGNHIKGIVKVGPAEVIGRTEEGRRA